MGISSKKSTTSSTSNSNFNSTNTQTPTNPDWVSNGLAGIGNSITDLSKLDPYSLVADPNTSLLQAQEGAGSLQNRPWLLDAATGTIGNVINANAPQVGSAATASPYIQQYLDPYTNDVVNTTLAGYDQNSNQQTQQANLDLAGDATFGGSGGSIYKALLAGQQGLGRAQTEAQIRDQGFQTALGAANNDANRSESAKELNATLRGQQLDRALTGANNLVGLSNNYDANTRANIGTLSDIGSIIQQIQQQKAGSPLALLGAQAGLFGSLPLGLLHGQTDNTTGTQNSTSTGTGTESGASLGDWLGFFAANAAAAAKAAGAGGP